MHYGHRNIFWKYIFNGDVHVLKIVLNYNISFTNFHTSVVIITIDSKENELLLIYVINLTLRMSNFNLHYSYASNISKF